MNRLVPLVIFLGLIATWFQGGLAANVLISDGAKFVVNASQYLSVSDQYFLVMQPDCALVLYNHSGRPVASSRNSTSSRFYLQGTCSLWLQSDGNLVIFKLDSTTYLDHNQNQEIWNQGYSTVSVGGDASTSLLLLGGDGSLKFYDYNIASTRHNQTGTMNDYGKFESVNASAALAYKEFIPSDFQAWKPEASLDGFPYMPVEYFLSPGKRLLALSKSYELTLGTDCNLVCSILDYSGGTPVPLWESGTRRSETSLCQLTLQPNGVLQIHSTVSSEVYWNSTTSGTGNSSVSWILKVDPDIGRLSISDITNTSNILWTNDVEGRTSRAAVVEIYLIVVGIIVGGFVLGMAALGLCLYSRKHFLHPADKAFQVRLRANGGNSQAFSQAKIKRATKNFGTLLGRGGFGDVFYGKLPDGTEVAAKVLSANSHQSKQEFYNEIELLSKVHHKYLVSLLGFCCTRKHQVLLYGFMGGGNLRQRLQAGESAVENPFPDPLSWQQRTRIILQVAEGLEYLHHKCSPPIIHRDVKSTNILLTHNLVAKVADFGLSKLKTIGQEDATHVTTAVKGTPGYLDPEYHETGLLTEKSDVYAFGVVLLEILTGRHHMFIAQGVRDAWRLEQFDDMADPNVREDYDREELINLVELALWCARTSSLERPSMDEVVRRLHDVLLPPSEPSAMESAEEYAHCIRSIELMALNLGNISSETVPFSELFASSMSSEAPWP